MKQQLPGRSKIFTWQELNEIGHGWWQKLIIDDTVRYIYYKKYDDDDKWTEHIDMNIKFKDGELLNFSYVPIKIAQAMGEFLSTLHEVHEEE